MSKTKFNKKMTDLLNNQIDDVDLARIKAIIGDKNFEYAYIDQEWIDEQYVGDKKEFSHPKFGTVTIDVEINVLDIIGNNVLIENKRTYTGKYSEEVNVIRMYVFGPMDDDVRENMKFIEEE